MANPRIEEVEDDDENFSDPDEMDLEEFDFAQPKGSLGGAPSNQAAPSQAAMQSFLEKHTQSASAPSGNSLRSPGATPQLSRQDAERAQREQLQKSKHFQCIYPVYFDATRSREEGRRVKKEDAVASPLAREIVDALQHVGNSMGVPFHVVFEPAKMHPKDWANPGRVRVLIKENGEAKHAKIKNKHHLYRLIAEYLKSHPTTEESPLRLRVQGLPMPKDKIPPPEIPRGFKIGKILPLHSPALSGGGVSDNFLKDMMGEMGGQLPPGMEGMANLANMMGMGGSAPSSSAPSGMVPPAPQKKIKEKKKR